MAKSQNLNFTQALNSSSVMFNSSDTYDAIQVAVTSPGSNLTPGTRTFTLAGGTLVSGGPGAATFTVTVKGAAGAGFVSGPPTITNPGDYVVGAGPTAAANAATPDTGTSNATFAVTVGVIKTLYTSGANDAVVKAITVASTDSAARVMSLWLQEAAGGPLQLVGAINIPANAGFGSGTTAAVDLLGGTLLPALPYDSNGKRVIPLKAGTKLLVSVPGVTASGYISVIPLVEEY